ncbi:four helix bundle protein [Chryseobacterium profundimaris]|uniref:Four helix bundle protein n=1 Tax=Chryseobacterium profundimaris TaxID=1387275 RepID=A0ABY1NLM8_9FLAO|nr:four helix bundle protein [Chryseobacterium profundimaris]SMP13059.1 four helix bundle protein [Chryseobacterium profundimaris]
MKPHRNLKAWSDSILLIKDLYFITRSFPKEELFGITSQMRRAALSIPLNVAEGAARASKKEFVRFLDIAIGSIAELDTLFFISLELEFLSDEDFNLLNGKLDLIGKLVYGLKRKILEEEVVSKKKDV